MLYKHKLLNMQHPKFIYILNNNNNNKHKKPTTTTVNDWIKIILHTNCCNGIYIYNILLKTVSIWQETLHVRKFRVFFWKSKIDKIKMYNVAERSISKCKLFSYIFLFWFFFSKHQLFTIRLRYLLTLMQNTQSPILCMIYYQTL